MKTARLNLRLTERADETIRRAAEQAGVPVTRFVVDAAAEEADRVLADRTSFAVGTAEWDAFVAWLDRPAREVPGLRDLLERPDVFTR